MFCYQCQETCANKGCTIVGMCGKHAETSDIMDEMIQELKQLARYEKRKNHIAGKVMTKSLFMTLTNTNFDDSKLKKQLNEIRKLYPANKTDGARTGANCNPNIRSLNSILIFAAKGIAAYAYHAAELGYEDDNIYNCLFEILSVSEEQTSENELLALISKCGACALKAMAMLDMANCATFGIPHPATIRTGTGTNPGILVSGHDFRDLQELLEQTAEKNIDIYTHGEMLPAHCYPELNKYPHLAGNYGNSWHHQHNDFMSFHGPVLVTSNCLTPTPGEYLNRIFTTGAAGYPGIRHIPDRKNNKPRDFSAIINIAQQLKAPEKSENGYVECGYSHHYLKTITPQIAHLIENKKISRIIITAGCDGRQKIRDYYSNLAEQLDASTIIITCGCAKYRFNKEHYGSIEGIPRLIDAGQCNDVYSIAMFAFELKNACRVQSVNQLPISFCMAWYEQKAVAILLALLYCGFKNIRIGPTKPAFITEYVWQILEDKYGLKLISDPATDIGMMMRNL